MKRLLALAVAVGFGLSVGGAWAGGKELFVSKCGACHQKGGTAAPVNPADKASTVWQKYFKRGRHPGDLSATISQAELDEIVQFLSSHAADSDQPAAAVIPK